MASMNAWRDGDEVALRLLGTPPLEVYTQNQQIKDGCLAWCASLHQSPASSTPDLQSGGTRRESDSPLRQTFLRWMVSVVMSAREVFMGTCRVTVTSTCRITYSHTKEYRGKKSIVELTLPRQFSRH
ncbi:hypothetical protein E2C01_042961 [Portunus trituberculatus]|uniref:Uncharacterized protein n=1 Tax=Portunus trituberculatus TaxID=210409 RepID=A0A5B7FUE3_PORTR|nr:hypothetical protein [Portunus trituberculatus]